MAKTSSRKPREKNTTALHVRNEMQARIREAEKKTAPIGSERVGVDSESYEMLAVLIERGLGRKHDVLRKALALGLLTLRNTTSPTAEEEVVVAVDEYYEAPWPHNGPMARNETLVTEKTPEEIPLGAAIVTPPSEERRQQETE